MGEYRPTGRPVQSRPCSLDGKKLLVTGVLTDDSIAFAIARVAQEAGAEVVLTGVGRGMSLTQRVARKLPTTPDVLELDVNNPEHIEAVSAELMKRWGKLDGASTRLASCRGRAGRQLHEHHGARRHRRRSGSRRGRVRLPAGQSSGLEQG